MTALVTICAFTAINVNYFGFYFAKLLIFVFGRNSKKRFLIFLRGIFCRFFICDRILKIFHAPIRKYYLIPMLIQLHALK